MFLLVEIVQNIVMSSLVIKAKLMTMKTKISQVGPERRRR